VKRLLLVLLLCTACGREEPSNTTTAPPPASVPSASMPAAPSRGVNKSTPEKCAGDGSYEQALDCFRISSGFHFALDSVRGQMTRSTPGLERVQFKGIDGITWIGEAKHQGVVWSRNGAHDASPPDVVNHVWQRTTMVLDPQKKEGSPQLAGTETISGEPCNHYHFTNANTGESNDVWVSTRDGRIAKWKAGKSMLELH
jgi:hypothetical protein